MKTVFSFPLKLFVSFKLPCCFGFLVQTGIWAVPVSWKETLEAGLCVIPNYAKDTAPAALLQESDFSEPLQI